MKKLLSFIATIAIIGVALSFIFPLDKDVTDILPQIGNNKSSSSVSISKDSYWYNKLTDNEKKAYRNVYASILDFPEKVAIPKVDDKEIQNVFQALSYDNPELFFLGYSSSVISVGYKYYFKPEYVLSKELYTSYMEQVKTVVKEMNVATQGLSEYEKELYVHDYLISNCEYNDNAGDMKTTVYGALINKQANCEGYARSTQMILNNLGVKSRVIIGDATSEDGQVEGHMWNIVTLSGKEYNLDVTWDDSKVNGVQADNISHSHMYMNIPTKDIVSTHKSTYEQDYANCIYDDYNYYKISGLCFDSYDSNAKSKIINEIVRQSKKGGSNIEIKFSNKAAYDSATSRLFDSKEIHRLIVRANLETLGKIVNGEVSYTNTPDKFIIRVFYKLK